MLRADDAVVMLAALTPDRWRSEGMQARNFAMMQTLCAAREHTGCAHLVYISTDAMYDFASVPISEATPASPQDSYGRAHHAREQMALGLAGIPVMVLRSTLVFGLDDPHNAYGASRFRRMAATTGRIELFGGGDELRDQVHVDDVAELIVRCLFRRTSGRLNVVTAGRTRFAKSPTSWRDSSSGRLRLSK